MFAKMKQKLLKLKQKKQIDINNDSVVVNDIAEFPFPFSGEGSGMFYNQNPQIKKETIINDFIVNFAELKPNELLVQYLKYVLQNSKDGLFRSTSKEVSTIFKISEDKADRIRKKAIEQGYLIPQLEKKSVLSVQENKIKKLIR